MQKFTLIIPTRQRADTLYWTLKTCLEQTYENFEIVISDNFSNDNTEEVVRSFNSNRINYYNSGKRLSMTANFENGLTKVTEGFVCFLGDDDALLPGCLHEISELLANTGSKALAWNPATYIWNSVSDKAIAGKLKLPVQNTYHLLNGNRLLKETEKDVYRSLKMPSPYWSFVDIELIKKCYRQGRFFHSFIPDTYAGTMIASVCNDFVFSNKPFSVSGSSHHSNALGFFNKKINQESNKTFLQENDLSIHPKMEIGPSSALLLAEPLLQAADRLENFRPDILKMLNTALWEASNCGDEELFTVITEKVKLAAQKNGIEKKIEAIIAKNKFANPSNKEEKRINFVENELFIQTAALNEQGFKLQNIYDASKFVLGLLGAKNPEPEEEPKTKESSHLIKKISGLLHR